MPIGDDAFRVFISHKQEDHALAVEVKRAVEGLDPELIDCFVSGVDIAAGMDWRREIRSVLAESHLLVLLFTAPTKNWDWCLYETGLYTRFDLADPRSVVCLSAAGQGSPSPLADLQGVPVDVERLGAFLDVVVPQDLGGFRRLAPRAAGARDRARSGGGRRSFHCRGVPPVGRPSRPTTRAIALYCRFPSPTTWRTGFPRARGWSWGRVTPRNTRFRCLTLRAEAARGAGAICWRPWTEPTPTGGASSTRISSGPWTTSSSRRSKAECAARVRVGLTNGSTVRSSTASCAGQRSDPRPGIPPSPTSDRAR